MNKKSLLKFIITVAVYYAVIMAFVIGTNVLVDAASVIEPRHTDMAKLSLAGNVVVQPPNYNERIYQVSIVDNMKDIPETVVIGGSRGMYLGEDITGYIPVDILQG